MTDRTCLTKDCGQPAKGHFCSACWAKLPWDMKAAITSSRKTGQRRPEHVKRAKDYIEAQAKPPEGAC